MPVARYFLFVGGVLLALLFVFDAYLPKVPVTVTDRTEAGADKSIIRIHSDRKWPERIVFDTSLPTIIPAVRAEAAVPAPATVAEVSAKVRVRESFAQFVPPEPKKPELKLHPKRKIAKRRVAPPTVLVAQQPQFGFFANNRWFANNAW
jgi:hypothetical protein